MRKNRERNKHPENDDSDDDDGDVHVTIHFFFNFIRIFVQKHAVQNSELILRENRPKKG